VICPQVRQTKNGMLFCNNALARTKQDDLNSEALSQGIGCQMSPLNECNVNSTTSASFSSRTTKNNQSSPSSREELPMPITHGNRSPTGWGGVESSCPKCICTCSEELHQKSSEGSVVQSNWLPKCHMKRAMTQAL
jgi:hypothetical protein